jgi:hypothetical protein
VNGEKMPLCQSEQGLRVLQEMQQRRMATAKQTLLVVAWCHERQQAARKEGLVRGGTECGRKKRQATLTGLGCWAQQVHACPATFVGRVKFQSKKAVLAGARPDPKTAFKKRFSI